jgi:phosphinothricin acetyltransferase
MLSIRSGITDDLSTLHEIYNHYVLHSNITFDTEPYTLEQRREWFTTFAPNGPHRLLVAEADGKVVGAATSSPYRAHPAFSETVETGIYLDPLATGQGVGTQLYGALFETLRAERVHRIVAGVALPNAASVALHRRCGFREVGTFFEYARKHGTYVSSVWFEKELTR